MKKELLVKEIQYMLENDIIEESQSNWSAPCILVSKHDDGFRFCKDFRNVNDNTKSDSFPIPRITDCIDQIGNAKFAERLLAGTFNSGSSRNFRICNTKGFISVQGHAVWNEKCSSNIEKNG